VLAPIFPEFIFYYFFWQKITEKMKLLFNLREETRIVVITMSLVTATILIVAVTIHIIVSTSEIVTT